MNRRRFIEGFWIVAMPPSPTDTSPFVGDGATDNGPILNRVLSTNPANVPFPAGRFLFLAPVALRSGISLSGFGEGTEFIRGFDDVFIQGEGISSVNISSILMRDQQAKIMAPFIYLNSQSPGKRIDIGRVFIKSPGSAGIAVDNSDGVSLHQNTVVGAGHGDSLRCARCRNVVITGNSLRGLAALADDRRAIQVGGSKAALVSNNLISDAHQSFAMDFGGSSDVLAKRNSVIDCAFGVDLEGGSKDVVISENYFRQAMPLAASSIGIYLINGDCQDIVISDNRFVSLNLAVRIEGSTRISVNRNRFENCKNTVEQSDAIRGQAPTEIDISDNTIEVDAPLTKVGDQSPRQPNG